MLALYLSLIDTENDQTRFTALYDANYKMMFAVAFEKARNYQAAEDIVHNAFLRVIKILNDGRLDDQKNVDGYLATITINEAIKYWQRQRNEGAEAEETLLDFMPKADYTVNTFEMEQLVQQVMQLEEKYKQPLLLYTKGYSVREIAQTLELTQTNVKQRMHRARRMLLKTLEDC